MSEPVLPLGGARFSGIVRVSEAGPRGMITLRGDLGAKAVRKAAKGAVGLDVPDANGAAFDGERGICWMSPDELLILLPYGDVDAAMVAMGKTLKGQHHLLANVSDARAVFRLEGAGHLIRDTLAKLTPADLRPSALPVLTMRRTRLAQVPAAFVFHAEDKAELICFRSVADYVFGLLKTAAAPGSEVAHF